MAKNTDCEHDNYSIVDRQTHEGVVWVQLRCHNKDCGHEWWEEVG